MKKYVTVEIVIVAFILLIGLYFAYVNYNNMSDNKVENEEVLSEDVTVSVGIPFDLKIWIKPENRIPPVGNDSLYIDVSIENSSSSLYATNLTVNYSGTGTVGYVSESTIESGYYDIKVKGLSHLTRNFQNEQIGPENTFMIDLTDQVLKAGDTHPTSDDYVNSLDISYSILNIYTSDLRADLNRDSKVNSLDFPTMISHLYEHGDE